MSEHNAGYFRPRDRADGDSASGPFSAPKFPRRAIEPSGLEQLPWSRNLFGDLASIEELLAETVRSSARFDENPGDVFRCGCSVTSATH